MTNRNQLTNCIVTGLLLSGASTALATPGYEDLPLGTIYAVGDSTSSEGLPIEFTPFQWWSGTWTVAGQAEIVRDGWACTPNQELGLNNITAAFNYGASGTVPSYVRFNFGEHGGNINVSINGDFHNVPNFLDLHGLNIGGADFYVLSGGSGHDCGVVEIHGLVQKMELGGQELWIDNYTTENDPCRYGYEDLTLGDVYLTGDMFMTSGILCQARPFQYSTGAWTNGAVRVVNTGLACATGNELWCNREMVRHDFAASIGSMTDVSIQFGEYGGNINVSINGDFRNVDNFMDLDGMVVGGVLVTIPYGGLGNDCGKMTLDGTVHSLALGGHELWIDCLDGTPDPNGGQNPQPGDTNDDRKIDVMDLLNVIQSWGTCQGPCEADLDEDGSVNVHDLLMVLEYWK